MNQKDIQHIKVGVFVFVALSFSLFVIFILGSEKRVFESHYKLKCQFSDISGLRVGAPVQLAGIRVGYVDDIRFPKDLMTKEIDVVMDISEKYKSRIRADSVATINTQGLLGDKYIFISLGSAEEAELENGAIIKAQDVVGLFDLAEKGGDIMKDLQEASKAASKFFSGLQGGKDDMQGAMEAVRDILTRMEKGPGLLHALVYEPKGEAVVNDLAASMNSLKILLGESADDETTHQRVRSITANLNRAALNLNDITETIKSGEGTIGGLVYDPTIYNDIRGIFGKANRNNVFKAVVRSTLKENDKEVLK